MSLHKVQPHRGQVIPNIFKVWQMALCPHQRCSEIDSYDDYRDVGRAGFNGQGAAVGRSGAYDGCGIAMEHIYCAL